MRVVYPKVVAIETVRGCNSRCVMCPLCTSRLEHGLMARTLFDKILDELRYFADRIGEVKLWLNGEPCLDPYIVERVELCSSAGIKNISIASNGSKLDKYMAREMMAAGLKKVIFSLNSVVEKTYRSITRTLDLRETLANILDFIEVRNRFGYDTSIVIRFIEQELNKEEFSDFYDYWSKRLKPGMDFVHRFKVHRWARGGKIADSARPCNMVFEQINIAYDGRVPICCMDYDMNYVCGDVSKSSVLGVFNGDVLVSVRLLHSSGRRYFVKICSSCGISERWGEKDSSIYYEVK